MVETSQPGFLASLGQEEEMQSTHKKSTPWATRRKYQFPIAAWQHEVCHAFSIPQSLLLLSPAQLTHITPDPVGTAAKARAVLAAFSCTAWEK